MRATEIAQVRSFNRLVTQRIGALSDHFLGRDRPLGASRLLYEIGTRGADLRELRARLDLDSGYVSRLVKLLEDQGLLRSSPARADARVRQVRLTAAGRREVQEMNRRSDAAAASLLKALPVAPRTRLLSAMAEVHRLLQLAGLRIERADPASPAARACIERYFGELRTRFAQGFDPATSPVADADVVPPRGEFLIARSDGEAVACGALKVMNTTTAYLKRMWVADSMRGLGVGRRMLEALEGRARALGLTTVQLETNGALHEAIQLYRSAGYHEVAPFNDEPYAHHWFEKRLAS